MLTVFVKLHLRCSREYWMSPTIGWLYVKKSSISDVSSDLRSACINDVMMFLKKLAIHGTKHLPPLPIVFLSKIHKYMVTWSKSSILIVVVVQDPQTIKFAWGKGMKNILFLYVLRILTARRCLRVKLCT